MATLNISIELNGIIKDTSSKEYELCSKLQYMIDKQLFREELRTIMDKFDHIKSSHIMLILDESDVFIDNDELFEVIFEISSNYISSINDSNSYIKKFLLTEDLIEALTTELKEYVKDQEFTI